MKFERDDDGDIIYPNEEYEVADDHVDFICEDCGYGWSGGSVTDPCPECGSTNFGNNSKEGDDDVLD